MKILIPDTLYFNYPFINQFIPDKCGTGDINTNPWMIREGISDTHTSHAHTPYCPIFNITHLHKCLIHFISCIRFLYHLKIMLIYNRLAVTCI